VRQRGTVSKKHEARILKAKANAERADREYRDAVAAAKHDPEQPASVRELAKLTGLSPATVQRWTTDTD
jgi:transcriptional regulator GlxA family with amidase domain